MKTKTLLLGSAAALLMAGGAQAADLSIAAPVDYVRVCDAFGVGYWYIPGTDTCLKIGGYVQFDIKFQRDGWVFSEGGVSHSSHWKFVTEAAVNFTASSMTEYGLLESYANFKGVYDPDGGDVTLDGAWLRLGHVRMGHFGSVQNTDGGYAPGAWVPDVSTNQIELSWAASGFGLMLGIEDPRERWGTELAWHGPGGTGYSMPDITGAVTFSAGHLDAKITAGWGQLQDWQGGPGDQMGVYGVAGTLTANMDQFSLRAGGSFGTGSRFVGEYDSLFVNGANNWTAFISAIFRATSAISIAGTFAYAHSDFWAPGYQSATAGGLALVWSPVAGFSTTIEGKAWKADWDTEHNWEAKIRFKRTFP
jgi:hypothetical protein